MLFTLIWIIFWESSLQDNDLFWKFKCQYFEGFLKSLYSLGPQTQTSKKFKIKKILIWGKSRFKRVSFAIHSRAILQLYAFDKIGPPFCTHCTVQYSLSGVDLVLSHGNRGEFLWFMREGFLPSINSTNRMYTIYSRSI